MLSANFETGDRQVFGGEGVRKKNKGRAVAKGVMESGGGSTVLGHIERNRIRTDALGVEEADRDERGFLCH